jgi:hypothetical protein
MAQVVTDKEIDELLKTIPNRRDLAKLVIILRKEIEAFRYERSRLRNDPETN